MAAATSSVEPFLVANAKRIWLKAYTSYHKMMWLPANRGVGPNVTSVVMTLVSAISIIARVNDPANDELFNHSWRVDALVSPATALV